MILGPTVSSVTNALSLPLLDSTAHALTDVVLRAFRFLQANPETLGFVYVAFLVWISLATAVYLMVEAETAGCIVGIIHAVCAVVANACILSYRSMYFGGLNAPETEAALLFSCGYYLYDTVVVLRRHEMSYVVHHLICFAILLMSTCQGHLGWDVSVAFIIGEISNPCMNIREITRKKASPRVHLVASVLFCVTFCLARGIGGSWIAAKILLAPHHPVPMKLLCIVMHTLSMYWVALVLRGIYRKAMYDKMD